MTNSRTTKKALLSSALALLMCVAMLIATTFAWFTDTASTSVNKIQAGKLDVALEMYDTTSNQWVNAVGKTLEFKKAADGSGQEVLWEPGCIYELPKLRIVNNGNLALKYKVVITGIKGSAKLNEAIEWTIDDVALGTEQHLLAGGNAEFSIKGHMKEDAGNDYQNESIDGISITVLATQDTVEYDSTRNNYDAEAQYPVVAVSQVAVDSTTKQTTGSVTIKSAATVSGEDTIPLATAIVPEGVLTTSADGASSTQLKLTINKATTPANFTYDTSTLQAATLEIKMDGLATGNEKLITVQMYVGKELSDFALYHSGEPMNAKDSVDNVNADNEYFYNSTTGIVTMMTKSFSPFTYTYAKDTWRQHAASAYATPVDSTAKIVTISSAEELALFANEVSNKRWYKEYTIKLANDIDLGAYLWEPITDNSTSPEACMIADAKFDGEDHTISNMVINGADFVGLFGNVYNMTIRNLTVDNAAVVGTEKIGTIVGRGNGKMTIENCKVINSDIDGTNQVGSVAGDFQGDGGSIVVSGCTVSNCNVTGKQYIGGLVGRVVRNSTVKENSVSNTTVTGTKDVDEVVGSALYANCTVENNNESGVTLNIITE